MRRSASLLLLFSAAFLAPALSLARQQGNSIGACASRPTDDLHYNLNKHSRSHTTIFCPVTHAWISSIVERMITSSDELQSLTREFGPIQVDIWCESWASVNASMGLPHANTREEADLDVNAATVLNAQSEDEVAFLVAHELAHYMRCHSWNSPPEGHPPPDATYDLWLIQRQKEAVADEIGLELLAQAGYDPMAAATSLQGMRRAGAGRSIEIPWLGARIADFQLWREIRTQRLAYDHPTYRERIASARAEISREMLRPHSRHPGGLEAAKEEILEFNHLDPDIVQAQLHLPRRPVTPK